MATRTATGRKNDLQSPEGNCRSDAEPPAGFEPATYALRVSRPNGRQGSSRVVVPGGTAPKTQAIGRDSQRTATAIATPTALATGGSVAASPIWRESGATYWRD